MHVYVNVNFVNIIMIGSTALHSWPKWRSIVTYYMYIYVSGLKCIYILLSSRSVIAMNDSVRLAGGRLTITRTPVYKFCWGFASFFHISNVNDNILAMLITKADLNCVFLFITIVIYVYLPNNDSDDDICRNA